MIGSPEWTDHRYGRGLGAPPSVSSSVPCYAEVSPAAPFPGHFDSLGALAIRRAPWFIAWVPPRSAEPMPDLVPRSRGGPEGAAGVLEQLVEVSSALFVRDVRFLPDVFPQAPGDS